MKTLYESLLDDFDNLGHKQDTALRDEILKGTWFRLGNDMKTIIFEPEENTSGRDRNTTPRLYWVDGKNYETSLSDVGVCKNLGLKFQPLAYVSDEIIGRDDDWLKYFDCEYVVTFIYSVQSGTRPTIDMSKIKFPIIGKVAFAGYSTIDKIIAYPKPLEMVRFLVQVRQPIIGWKCKHMIIDNTNNIMFDLVKHDLNASQEEREQKLIEWVDELLKNNPDTETIYLSNFHRYTDHVKVVTKGRGANRKCVKLAKFPDSKFRTLCYKNPTIEKMERDVEAWRWQHADLYECDGAIAATPGNTLGMGNPMAPTATEPGTEPIIPKHPRNKKDKKKIKNLKESLLDDFDKMSDFQDIEMILDDPNFNKNNFNKLKRLFKKAGAGEDYTDQDKNNTETMFIGYKRGGLNNTSEVIVGIPAVAPTLTRTYFPGYRHTYYSDRPVRVAPNVWSITNVPAAGSGHFWRNTAGPISIPDKYAPYFKMLMQNAPKWGSKEFRELNR